MKIIALIPVHLNSKRFPKKAITMIGSKTLIESVYDNVIKSKYLDNITIITNSDVIYKLAVQKHYDYCYYNKSFKCGTDRIADCVHVYKDYNIVLNIQGDLLIDYKALDKFVKTAIDTFNDWEVITPICKILSIGDLTNPNLVKVVKSKSDRALYFSRSIIPNRIAISTKDEYYEHVGLYAFKPNILQSFPTLPISHLEDAEHLEQLRFLENDIDIHTVEIDSNASMSINTPDDLKKI